MIIWAKTAGWDIGLVRRLQYRPGETLVAWNRVSALEMEEFNGFEEFRG